MTDEQISQLGPAFADYLGGFRSCFAAATTAGHFDTLCRGLLSDLPRKSVEPIALSSGTDERTLQLFLTGSKWDHGLARDLLQRRVAGELAAIPGDDLGTVGVIDETSAVKKGTKTPGVRRQYLGCVGKIDNGIVTVVDAGAKVQREAGRAAAGEKCSAQPCSPDFGYGVRPLAREQEAPRCTPIWSNGRRFADACWSRR